MARCVVPLDTAVSRDTGWIAALSQLAARVQRGRTVDAVLRIAGEGIARLGMRFAAFQLDGTDLVLRSVATAKPRQEAIERLTGGALVGLRAPLARCSPAAEILARRENVYRSDLDLFVRFVEAATGRDPSPLDAFPATAGIANGVVAPLFVREEPWGLLSLVSDALAPSDAAAVALFATQVGSALEVAEFVHALERAQGELIARERLATIGEFAAMIAHEVRNPLAALYNSVAGLRRLLRDDGVDPNVELLLSIANEEAGRMNRIVNDLLDFARPQPRRMRMRASTLSPIVRDVTAEIAKRSDASKVDVRLDLCADLPPIELDASLIRQALSNLVMNAIQAMPQGGTLVVRTRVELRADAIFACIDVADTGQGIAPEDQERILQPFFTTKRDGTGLGLALVQRVVEAHGAELGITSGAGGTTFTMRLPMGARRPAPALPLVESVATP